MHRGAGRQGCTGCRPDCCATPSKGQVDAVALGECGSPSRTNNRERQRQRRASETGPPKTRYSIYFWGNIDQTYMYVLIYTKD